MSTATTLLAENRVRIWLVNDKVISARARGDDGIVDVHWTRALGWSCSCSEPDCEHRAAVELVTATSAAGANTFDGPERGEPA